MKTLKIEIPEGHEIDIQNSDLTKGIVKFKKVESKYPTFPIHNSNYIYHIDSYSIIRKNIVGEGKVKTSSNFNTVSSKSRAEAFLALMQLVELRDSWNKIDQFELDFTNNHQIKHYLNVYNNKISTGSCSLTQHILSFKSPWTRDLFLETFRDLIETAKEFL